MGVGSLKDIEMKRKKEEGGKLRILQKRKRNKSCQPPHLSSTSINLSPLKTSCVKGIALHYTDSIKYFSTRKLSTKDLFKKKKKSDQHSIKLL